MKIVKYVLVVKLKTRKKKKKNTLNVSIFSLYPSSSFPDSAKMDFPTRGLDYDSINSKFYFNRCIDLSIPIKKLKVEKIREYERKLLISAGPAFSFK